MSRPLKRRIGWLCLATTLLSFAACKVRRAAIDSSSPLIVGGEPLAKEHIGRTSAVAISHDGKHRCTGVLVAPHIIMTANHCLEGEPEKFVIHFSEFAYENSQSETRRIRRAVGHRPWRKLVGPRFDIAFMELDADAPAPFAPAPIFLDWQMLTEGQDIHLVGYGRTSDTTYDYGRLLTAPTQFKKAVDDEILRYAYFTGPTPGKGTCNGDSGGPTYIEVAGKWYLLGIISHAPPLFFDDSTCAAGNDIQMLVEPFVEWFESTSGARLTLQEIARPKSRSRHWVPDASASFADWCKGAADLPDEAWFTLSHMLESVAATSCDLAVQKLADSKGLGLAGRTLQDLAPLASLPQLRRLNLGFNRLTDLSPLAQLTDLEMLNLQDNFIRDLRPLTQLPAIDRLLLHGNQLTSLSNLAKLPNLATLIASCNKLETLPLLNWGPSLSYLDISGNQALDLSNLGTWQKQRPDVALLFGEATTPCDRPNYFGRNWD